MRKKYSPSARKSNLKKRRLVSIGAALVALVAVGSMLYATKTFPFNDQEPALTYTTANSETKGEPQQQTGQSNQDEDESVPSDNKSETNTTNNNTDTSAPLKKPEGNFVNAHKNVSMNSAMQSSCITTAGANCQIIFTKDGITRTLDTKKTDAGGGAFWEWTPQSVGLSAGNWKVQAKATLGTQTQTSDDALNLEIGS